MTEPFGFLVSCTDKKSKAPYQIKLYSIERAKRSKKVRFRFLKRFGSFPEHELASKAASDYAITHGFPFAYSRSLHNRIAPSVIYKWYFKEPPIKMLESVFR